MPSLALELHRLMKANGLTQVQLADKTGSTQSYMSKLVRGEKENIGADLLYKMCAALKVPADHFAPYLAPGVAVPPPPVPIVPTLTDAGIEIPFIGYVQAGGGVDEPSETDEMVSVSDAFRGASGVYRVRGKSMLGANIQEGDELIVKLDPDPPSGELVIAWKQGRGAMVKRYFNVDYVRHLESDRGGAEEEIPGTIQFEDGDRIIGVVIGIQRKYEPESKPRNPPTPAAKRKKKRK